MANYEGFSNQETWQVAFHIDNDPGLYAASRELAPQHSAEEYGDILRASFENEMPEEVRQAIEGNVDAPWAFFVQSSWDAVDWTEVGEHIKASVKEHG